MYQRGAIDPARVARALAPLDYLARRRYGLDALYAGIYRGFILGFSRLIGWIDRYFVDGILNALTALTLRAGGAWVGEAVCACAPISAASKGSAAASR